MGAIQTLAKPFSGDQLLRLSQRFSIEAEHGRIAYVATLVFLAGGGFQLGGLLLRARVLNCAEIMLPLVFIAVSAFDYALFFWWAVRRRFARERERSRERKLAEMV
ncbi:MAG: hypothetical protein JWM68_749 [Verrucomicrobiales bacterium]|nr:hypothetical protein [Verrucomicrobiales bacterium]